MESPFAPCVFEVCANCAWAREILLSEPKAMSLSAARPIFMTGPFKQYRATTLALPSN
eukprot:CAMPEP_0174988432 /NCGR_PEP_ID=MMETSP0004_2-20121128/20123_1 /TAXON_ID=420556 /ORGANISM="Ochromonas sp., Strain CCMP1393" /LENGTH=57 /DNA_ID=CAMNT_0016241649 /DNA_START=244 /DNA_END=414 /DNA_ORIENTATION=-